MRFMLISILLSVSVFAVASEVRVNLLKKLLSNPAVQGKNSFSLATQCAGGDGASCQNLFLKLVDLRGCIQSALVANQWNRPMDEYVEHLQANTGFSLECCLKDRIDCYGTLTHMDTCITDAQMVIKELKKLP